MMCRALDRKATMYLYRLIKRDVVTRDQTEQCKVLNYRTCYGYRLTRSPAQPSDFKEYLLIEIQILRDYLYAFPLQNYMDLSQCRDV